MAKLVEILARELKEWPDQYYQIFQDSEGCVHGTLQNDDLEDCDQEDLPYAPLSIAWDGVNAIVTRAEWQAAVDALKAKEVAGWDGVGLPPVGTVCEFKDSMDDGSDWHNKLESGMEVKIVAHFENNGVQIAAFTFEYARGCIQVEQAVAGCFAPIRTPEQIAAEERREAIAGIAEDLGNKTWGVTIQEWLYDLGYRKQEPK